MFYEGVFQNLAFCLRLGRKSPNRLKKVPKMTPFLVWLGNLCGLFLKQIWFLKTNRIFWKQILFFLKTNNIFSQQNVLFENNSFFHKQIVPFENTSYFWKQFGFQNGLNKCFASGARKRAKRAKRAKRSRRMHILRDSRQACVLVYLCPFVLFACFFSVRDHAYVVLVICFHALLKFHFITRFPFLCQYRFMLRAFYTSIL